MKSIKTVVAAALVAIIASGCTSMQSSVYRNESVAGQTRIYATGQAAVEAAKVGKSNNCPSCGPGPGTGGSGSNSGGYSYKEKPMTDKILDSASSALERKISRTIADAIDKL